MKETAKYKNSFLERAIKLIAMPFNILILNNWRVTEWWRSQPSVWCNILVLVTATFFIFYTDTAQKSYN